MHSAGLAEARLLRPLRCGKSHAVFKGMISNGLLFPLPQVVRGTRAQNMTKSFQRIPSTQEAVCIVTTGSIVFGARTIGCRHCCFTKFSATDPPEPKHSAALILGNVDVQYLHQAEVGCRAILSGSHEFSSYIYIWEAKNIS